MTCLIEHGVSTSTSTEDASMEDATNAWAEHDAACLHGSLSPGTHPHCRLQPTHRAVLLHPAPTPVLPLGPAAPEPGRGAVAPSMMSHIAASAPLAPGSDAMLSTIHSQLACSLHAAGHSNKHAHASGQVCSLHAAGRDLQTACQHAYTHARTTRQLRRSKLSLLHAKRTARSLPCCSRDATIGGQGAPCLLCSTAQLHEHLGERSFLAEGKRGLALCQRRAQAAASTYICISAHAVKLPLQCKTVAGTEARLYLAMKRLRHLQRGLRHATVA